MSQGLPGWIASSATHDLANLIAGVVVLIALCYSLYLGYEGWGVQAPQRGGEWPKIKKWQLLVLLGWTLVPPLWFVVEFFFFYKPSWPRDDFELFKYGQDVSAKAWLGISTTLLLLYFGKDLKG